MQCSDIENFSSPMDSASLVFFFLILARLLGCMAAGKIELGSNLLASENKSWVSENGTFAFGFTQETLPANIYWLFGSLTFLEIEQLFGLPTDSPVTENATLELDAIGNLVLQDEEFAVWVSNSSGIGVEKAVMAESGNFILYSTGDRIAWQSFAYPSDTLLPDQPLTVSQELTSSRSSSHGGYYALKMLQQPTSLSLGLTYNLPKFFNDSAAEAYTNYSYWSGPDISNVTGDVLALVDEAGSFGILYGESSDGAVYVYKNDGDNEGLSSIAANRSTRVSILRRLILESNGNLRLYKWDDDVNGSRKWVPEWAAVSNPCSIAGICGNGICNLDRSKAKASCRCLPGTSKTGSNDICLQNSSSVGSCSSKNLNLTSQFNISMIQKTNYYFSKYSVIENYSDILPVTKCGDACLSNCDCVASVYGLDDEKPYCWLLRSLGFGGFEDPGSTLFVKVKSNGSMSMGSNKGESDDSSSSKHEKILVIPIVLSMGVLIALLCLLLYYNVHKRRCLKRAMESSLVVSGAPMNFSYRDLQLRTSNFSQLLGTGGFGSVFKGSLVDGTLVAVKKLDRALPHGEKEFITEVNTIGSMQHMNLVRLFGFCSEGSQRLLVYEFMKNGSLDKWIFPSYHCKDKVLDWPTRFSIAVATAQGIAYFHEQCRNYIIHCDIKPENILLDENFCPKVSDFGLAKLMGREHSHVVTMVRGTRGYLAPEWVSNRPITVKADVYSYGMLLLEIVGGRRNFDISQNADDFFYPELAFKAMTNCMPVRVVDKRLKTAIEEEELIKVLRVAFWCIQDEIFLRPSMGDVVKMLEGSMEITMPPMPQTVLQLIEEGLDNVYIAMKREYNHCSSLTIGSTTSSQATCSYSTMSPR